MRLKNYAIITIGIMVLAFTLPNAYAQNETRTFDDCYNEFMRLAALDFLLLPEKNLTLTDIPKYQNVAVKMCNFYHEKTGVWINLLSPDPSVFTEENGKEFMQRYGNEMPQEFKEKIGK
jgi:hypothetical protein